MPHLPQQPWQGNRVWSSEVIRSESAPIPQKESFVFSYRELANPCASECVCTLINTQRKTEIGSLTCHHGRAISIILNWNPVYCSVGLISSLYFKESCHLIVSFEAGTLQRTMNVQATQMCRSQIYYLFQRDRNECIKLKKVSGQGTND